MVGCMVEEPFESDTESSADESGSVRRRIEPRSETADSSFLELVAQL
ncbi:MAG: hypothetical protein ABEJ26_06955 [Halosimplex sp.]